MAEENATQDESADQPQSQSQPQMVMSCPETGKPIDVSAVEPGTEFQSPYTGKTLISEWRLGPYVLKKRLGSGGMGTIYLAVDEKLGRTACVKILKPELSKQPGFLETFAKEAQITASISHPNVVQVYHFGTERGVSYLAMELLNGGSLDDLMNREGKLSEQRALEIGIQAARGLKEAFSRGLLHRDVKPGNVLFSHDGTAKIVDFGLSMPLDEAREYDGEVWGTPYYVAPEKLDSKGEDCRSDIYSLAASLFHAMAGRAPFEADTVSLVAWKHLKAGRVSLKTFAPHIHNETARVINRALEREPSARYQNYDEFIDALEYALKTSKEVPLEEEKKVRDLTGAQAEQRLGLYIMAAAIILGIVIVTLFLVFNRAKQERVDPLQLELELARQTPQQPPSPTPVK